MKYIDESHLHPDVIFRGETDQGSFLELKPAITDEICVLQKISEASISSSELYWVEQKKLQLFSRVFGF